MTVDKKVIDLMFRRGTTVTYKVDVIVDKRVEDITGWTVYYIVKSNMNDTDAQAKISKTITTHSDPTAGESLIELSKDDTDITPGNYHYEVSILDDEGNEHVIITGRVKVKARVKDT